MIGLDLGNKERVTIIWQERLGEERMTATAVTAC